jgi:hypothetical protein
MSNSQNKLSYWINKYYFDWLIDQLFTVLRPSQEFFTHMDMSPLSVKAAQFRTMIGAQSFWAGWDLYRATRAVTRVLGFTSLIRRTVPFDRLLRHTRGCRVSILTWILTVHIHSPFTTHKGMLRTFFNQYPHGGVPIEKDAFIVLKISDCQSTVSYADHSYKRNTCFIFALSACKLNDLFFKYMSYVSVLF